MAFIDSPGRERNSLWVEQFQVEKICPIGIVGCNSTTYYAADTREAEQQIHVAGGYEWKVRACNSSGACGAVLSSGVIQLDKPQTQPAPREFAGAWLGTSPLEYELSWQPPESGDVSDYTIRNATTGATIATTSQLSYVVPVATGPQSSGGDLLLEVVGNLSEGGTTDAAQLSWTLPAHSPATPPSRTPVNEFQDLINLHIDSSSEVGATAGQFRVDEQGNTNYSIPIATGPSAGGMAPEISLNYNSAAPNGELGVGWSIGGMSAITRCAQTYEQDGPNAVAGVHLTSTDRFCLDGQRLVASDGVYGAADTEYRLESDPFTRIVSFGQVSGQFGPNWFLVSRQDGSKSIYGNSNDSRIRIEAGSNGSANTVLTWALTSITDSAGNEIVFEYCSSNGAAANGDCPDDLNTNNQVEYHIKRIQYGGAGYPNKIEFNWDNNRADASTAYLVGGRLTSTYLLESVDSFSTGSTGGQQLLRSYQLRYANDGDGYGRPTIDQITECGKLSPMVCFEPVKFNWHRSSNEFSSAKVTLPIGGSGSSNLNLFPDNYISGQPADLDGDGLTDFVFIHNGNPLHFGYIKVDGGAGSESLEIRRQAVTNIPSALKDNASGWFVMDYNQDGRDDVMYVHSAGSQRYWKGFRGQSTSPYINGTSQTLGHLGSVSNGDIGAVSQQDVDGDGRLDLLFINGGELWISRNQAGQGLPVNQTFAPAERIDYDNWSALELQLAQLFPDANEIFPSAIPGPSTPFDYDNDGAADLLVRMTARVRFGDTAARE